MGLLEEGPVHPCSSLSSSTIPNQIGRVLELALVTQIEPSVREVLDGVCLLLDRLPTSTPVGVLSPYILCSCP